MSTEKVAKKNRSNESPAAVSAAEWPSPMALWDVDPAAEAADADVASDANAAASMSPTDLVWDQAVTISSVSSPVLPSPALCHPEGILPAQDPMLLMNLDTMMSPASSASGSSSGLLPLKHHDSPVPYPVAAPDLLQQPQQQQQHSPTATQTSLPLATTQYSPCLPGDPLQHCSPPPATPMPETPLQKPPVDQVQPLLHVAVRSRNRAMIVVLLQYGGASVADQDANGETALHIATELADRGIVSLLLCYGADISIRNARGQDALHLAVSAGHTAIVELMLGKAAER